MPLAEMSAARVNGANGHSHGDDTADGSSDGTVTPRQYESRKGGVRLNELAGELGAMVGVLLEALQEVSPREILEPAREQFAASSVAVPAPTLAALYSGLQNLAYVARDLAPPARAARAGPRATFDIGDLLQSVGDMCSGMAARRSVELVIYHGDDTLHEQGQQAVKAVDFAPVYVRGNEPALAYLLSHVVRQTLLTAQPGDSIELGLFMIPTHRPDFAGDDDQPQAYHPTRCILDIAHKFTGRAPRASPNLETTLLQRLLAEADAELTLDSLFRPQCALGRACELRFTLPSVPPPPSPDPAPTLIHGVSDMTRFSNEPTFDQLADFAHILKDKKFSVTVYTKELSTEPLLASLSSWGVDLAVVGNGEFAPPPTPDKPAKGGRPFVFIDDDIDILKSQIMATPSKRPAIHRVQSSNHIAPRQVSNSVPAVTIVYFTSLDNFKLIKDTIRIHCPASLGSDMIVVPKPIGPRRLLTILYNAVTRPRVDLPFSSNVTPNHTSPPMPHSTLLTTSPSGETKPRSPGPTVTRSNSDRSVFSSKENVPVSPTSPSAGEYFPTKFTDNNPLTGIRIQDSDGSVQGIYFNPKVKSNPASPAAPTVAQTFASMVELANALPAESEPPPPLTESPLERIHLSRRSSTPQGSVIPRIGSEHNVVPPIKVLVVDDNRINREICGKALKKIGVACDLAVNGLEALNKWRTGEFHMILMDIQMPVMSGLEATRQIRQEERRMSFVGFPHGTPVADQITNTTPVRTPTEPGATPYPSSVVIVALTASRDEEDRVQALAAGCNDFLTKPVSTVWLHNKVTEWGSIKALQQWAPTGLPERISESQIKRAKRVASGLVPPIERRTPSPGQSKRRELPPDAPPPVPSPPASAPASGNNMNSAASSSGWSSLGIPTPVTGRFSPRASSGPGPNLQSIHELEDIHGEEHEPDFLGDVDVDTNSVAGHELASPDGPRPEESPH